MTATERKAEQARRVRIMVRVHGEWVRAHAAANAKWRFAHCDCSRCGLTLLPLMVSP